MFTPDGSPQSLFKAWWEAFVTSRVDAEPDFSHRKPLAPVICSNQDLEALTSMVLQSFDANPTLSNIPPLPLPPPRPSMK